MITIGLDFGTHQSKVCVEKIEGTECEYSFIKFENEYHEEFYALPSIINVGKDGRLSYGLLPKKTKGRLIRYFKQATFCTNSIKGLNQTDAMLFSCWYLAYIIFDLEKLYGQDFAIQMGAPSDSGHLYATQQIAVRILASAYRLVEDVFQNNKKAFLATDLNTLVEKTEILPYSDELKNDYGILVFPEAYACLKPLTSRGKIANGMNLMVDIGGGTTDISFFTIEQDEKSNVTIPQVYDFFSIDKGLNFLTDATAYNNKKDLDSNVKNESEIIWEKQSIYNREIQKKCTDLISHLSDEFHRQGSLSASALENALKNRPIIYCGGGSTFPSLLNKYGGFSDIKKISDKEWDKKSVRDMDEISKLHLCPILSTAYGLSIHATHDNIVCKPFEDIFEGIRQTKYPSHTYTENNSHYRSVYDDWDALK
ncbi:MAG: hypothetical protein HUJ98_08705 [Bacteroidaceae bacterium]|nr:hypothetical protein [Bacteroidaceae bacterium]